MKDDTSTPTEGSAPNEFERGKPGTNARSDAEAAIEDLRQRGGVFVNAVRATRMPMALTDPNLPGNPIVFANSSFLKLSGYSMDEVLGQRPHFMNGPGTDPNDARRFEEAIRSEQDDIIETVQYRKDGGRFVATVLISAFKDEQGRTLNHFMSWLDVTRRVDAESEVDDLKKVQSVLQETAAALRASEDRRDSALLAADMGTWDYDLIADVCHFDARAQEMYNLPSDQLDHRPEGVASVVHPDDAGPMFDEIQRATDVNGDGRYDVTYRIARGDGTYRWLRAVGITEFEGSGADKRAVRIVGSSRDITGERQAESALRESEQLLSAVLEVLPVGVGLIDTDGNYVILNNAMKRFLPTGRMPSRDPERGWRWCGWDEEGRRLEPNDFPGARAFRGETVVPGIEMIYTADDDQAVWTTVSALPLRGPDGAITGILNVVTDIDAVKRVAEALGESERHAKLLLAELQHRVRNTLAIVRSIAQRTAENSSSVDEMLGHFRGRLDAFSRVQAALTRSVGGTVSLVGLIEDELVAHAAREGEKVSLDGPDIELEPKTAERLSLAIHELTTNAVKHGALAKADGRIQVRWKRTQSNGSTRLLLNWKESGVEVDEKPEREGFGMELLRRSLPYDLQAETKVDLKRQGLEFHLDMPLPDPVEIS